MASTRLRKAFRYPSESDSEDEPDELDEEHQEKLISGFIAQDAKKNELYRNTFLAIPIISALFFTYTFFTASTARQRTIALLSVSSMISTASILKFMPIEAPDRKGKKPMYQVEAEKGPLEKYLVYLNAALAGLLLVASTLSWRKGLNDDAWREALPASKCDVYCETDVILTHIVVIMGITLFVRQQLAPLDLEELQKAMYEFKGA